MGYHEEQLVQLDKEEDQIVVFYTKAGNYGWAINYRIEWCELAKTEELLTRLHEVEYLIVTSIYRTGLRRFKPSLPQPAP